MRNMEALAKRLSDYLVRYGITSEEDDEVAAYGLFVMMSGAVQISLLVLIAFVLKALPAMAAFVLPYSLLKRTIGGWHAGSHRACLLGYTSLATMCVILGWHTPQGMTRPCTLLFGVFMVLTIWLRAPVEHPNNPQRPDQLLRYKRIGRAVSAAQWIALMGVGLIGGTPLVNTLALCGALGSAAAAATLLIPLRHRADQEGGEER